MARSVLLLFGGITLLISTVLGIPLFNTDVNQKSIIVPIEKDEIGLYLYNADETKRIKRDAEDDDDEEEDDGEETEPQEKSNDDNQKLGQNNANDQKQIEQTDSARKPIIKFDGHDDDVELGENTLEDIRELDKFYASARSQILGLHKFRISLSPEEAKKMDIFDDNKAIEMD